ncbi:hypothetical protein MMYC01_209821 [Madurella mycetomatis]|uniref:Uncharacterized protein n=1 Tax=Madurella mycetomatis TaxID=100816 RepID=A0A175VTI0_9PEZI|nr:hypothetical protein MMYC01_209821 [Madurella mycetomatis]
MKASVLFLVIAPLASAWKLELWGSDGRKVTMNGSRDTDCKNIDFSPVLNVNRAKFSPKTDWRPDPDTFELYANKNCDKLSYRNDGGNYKMKARKIRSYKVKTSWL